MRYLLSKSLLALATASTLMALIIPSHPAFSRSLNRAGHSSTSSLSTEPNASQNSSQLQPQAITPGFIPRPDYDLIYNGGYTIRDLKFVNFYMGGTQWNQGEMSLIDRSLAAAMSDPNLNNVMAQYFFGQKITSMFLGSAPISAQIPATVTQNTLETWVSNLYSNGALTGFNLSSTVFNFMLPKGAILKEGKEDSLHKLGGFHSSVHVTRPNGSQETVYYAVGVYSERVNGQENGVVTFNQAWKNVVATFYHELNETRTDPDIEDTVKYHNDNFLGWYSTKANGEVGDIPVQQAIEQSFSLSTVFKEVPLTNGTGTVPIQLMYSNAVHGPEGPITYPH